VKTLVDVELIAKCTVQVEVEHEHGESATDLTKEERALALIRADRFPDWEIDDVEVAP
jgi:hypothetical protein